MLKGKGILWCCISLASVPYLSINISTKMRKMQLNLTARFVKHLLKPPFVSKSQTSTYLILQTMI